MNNKGLGVDSMKKVLFVGSECYPFVKTGGLGDVMYALPKALLKEGYDVRVMIPNYRCIPWEYRSQMKYITHFYMDLGYDPNHKYVGIMTLELDGVTYYFIDCDDYFGSGNPYEEMSKDIIKYIFFDKAVLSALPVIGFMPDIIHCHDWQAGFVPVFLRTLFYDTQLSQNSKCIMTIHNLKFQGVANIDTVKYITAFPDYVYTEEKIKFGKDVNMLKGGLVFADKITTVSSTYSGEIKSREYGEYLDGVINYHHMKLCGILNGIDYDIYNPETDTQIYKTYGIDDAIEGKRKNKQEMQKEWGLWQDDNKFVIGLVSRLTDQKGLDLVNHIMERILDEHTMFVLIGTGEGRYESMFRYYEERHKGQVCSNILYAEDRSHKLFAGADAILVPSRFEPCGLTQMMALRYGAIPIVRATGGLKDTVTPYNEYEESGNGFSFTEYNADILLNVINYAKTIYFTRRDSWNQMIKRAMETDYSWKNSASQYRDLYISLVGE